MIRHIIPAISELRQVYRISYTTMFRHTVIMGKPIVPTLEIGDLVASDMVFNFVMNKYVTRNYLKDLDPLNYIISACS